MFYQTCVYPNSFAMSLRKFYKKKMVLSLNGGKTKVKCMQLTLSNTEVDYMRTMYLIPQKGRTFLTELKESQYYQLNVHRHYFLELCVVPKAKCLAAKFNSIKASNSSAWKTSALPNRKRKSCGQKRKELI